MKIRNLPIAMVLAFLFLLPIACNQEAPFPNTSSVEIIPVDTGWSRSSVNAVIFRQNSVITHDDYQYVSYYDADGTVVLAKRSLGSSDWQLESTQYAGNVRDAHNAISIGIDGDGFIHMVWGLHGYPIQYVRSTESGGLTLTDPIAMTGQFEGSVTYPQFYNIDGGDLLFVYREGASGNGNVMLNRYHTELGTWSVIQHPLIDGEGDRNAYINPVAIDSDGGWHISWNWRETPDVATNHNISYAFSPDEGETWVKSTGEPYNLPITYDQSDVIVDVPQNSELINQTTMTTDRHGTPFIVSYWRPENTEIPQYHLIWQNPESTLWSTSQVGQRTTPFSLSGFSTRRIPISRPLVLTDDDDSVYVIFRDEERGNGISIAAAKADNYSEWYVTDLDTVTVGQWEPTYDPAVWENHGELHLFRQHVGQGDNETLEDIAPQPVSILEWIP